MNPAAPPVRRNRYGVYFFFIVLALTIGATVFLAFFNLSLQLTPQELAKWRQLWAKNAPSSYNFGFTVKKDNEPQGKFYFAKVRQGKIVQALEDNQPMPRDRWRELSMEFLFDTMQSFLDEDLQEGKPKVYTRSRFHPETGALLEYVHRVMRTPNRLEISVQTYRYGKDVAP